MAIAGNSLVQRKFRTIHERCSGWSWLPFGACSEAVALSMALLAMLASYVLHPGFLACYKNLRTTFLMVVDLQR